MRIVIYGLIAFLSLMFLGIMVGIGYALYDWFGEVGVPFIVVMLIVLLIVHGTLRFMERYVLYMIKLGHIAVVVELLRTGKLPEGKGLIGYGKAKVIESFGSAHVEFVVDKMIYATVRQVQRWIVLIGEWLRFAPGSGVLIGILNSILSVGLNYIDEPIMSYIFLRKSEKHPEIVWKSASDGIVLYAQSWQGIIKSSVISVLLIYAFNIIMFLLCVIPFLAIVHSFPQEAERIGIFYGILAIIAVIVVTTVLKRGFIDPIVTIIMIRDYHMNIRGQAPSIDLQEKLLNISPRFKRLFSKTEERTPAFGP